VSPLLEVRELKKHFPIHRGMLARVSGQVYAVDGVSFQIARGETLGLVGESGCGKSTVGRTLLKLLEPTEGAILVRGEDITDLDAAQMLPYRRQMQMIYQDPYASLNPRMSAGEIVGEPLIIHRIADAKERREQVAHLFERVGLRPELIDSYPHEFSGGQRQRIGIARALIRDNPILILDEPTAALDAESEGLVIEALERLMAGRTVIIIAHRLSTLRNADKIIVIKDGALAEDGSHDELLERDGVYAQLHRLQFQGSRLSDRLALGIGDEPLNGTLIDSH
jgi:ABC-type microcin C transport system duplicated ATPase subunit YejF